MRFHGRVGYFETVETEPGLFKEQITFREYYGDVLRNFKRDSMPSKVNVNINIIESTNIININNKVVFLFISFNSFMYFSFLIIISISYYYFNI